MGQLKDRVLDAVEPLQGRCNVERTEVEGTADGGNDELNGPESTHNRQNGAVLVEDGVDSDNMSG